MLNLAKNCVVFTYPKMGKSGKFLPDELKDLDGLTGCTMQCKAYQENLNLIQSLGYKLIAIGSQSKEDMNEFITSLGLGFEVISDVDFKFEKELELKTFSTDDGKKFYHRQTLIFKDGKLVKRFDFVANPQDDVKNVMEILKNLS
ncbi:redoxin domain-containing protein [Campylobacter geochelonis]|uniref:redoxin domain-containing protein n=1 Tax=Campylobacter geochelonis TaxID=1780362 RepID=UPI000770948B|nr:redoxin domain-containing protein [Campylobacter geochelonis]CZE46858.1 putative BcpB [Campylobacter geochelonis]